MLDSAVRDCASMSLDRAERWPLTRGRFLTGDKMEENRNPTRKTGSSIIASLHRGSSQLLGADKRPPDAASGGRPSPSEATRHKLSMPLPSASHLPNHIPLTFTHC